MASAPLLDTRMFDFRCAQNLPGWTQLVTPCCERTHGLPDSAAARGNPNGISGCQESASWRARLYWTRECSTFDVPKTSLVGRSWSRPVASERTASRTVRLQEGILMGPAVVESQPHGELASTGHANVRLSMCLKPPWLDAVGHALLRANARPPGQC